MEHDAYAMLGMLAAHSYLTLAEGASAQASLRAVRTRPIAIRLCRDREPEARRATLRIIMVDSTTFEPFSDVPFRVSWAERGSDGATAWREQQLSAVTDRSGAVNFCNLPSRVPLEVAIERANREPLRVSVLQLAPNQVAAQIVFSKR
jgi:hypothetical protein